MLDGVHAVFQRHLHALGRFGVGSHGIAQPVGFITDSPDHLRLHLQLAGGALLGGIHHAARDHQLDQVHPLFTGPAELGQRFGIVVGRHCHRACHVSAGHRDALVGGKDAGSQDLPLCRVVPAAGIEICQTAHGADGGHAAQQFQLGVTAHQPVSHRPGQAIAQDPAHQCGVIPGLCAGFAVACQMDMQVDEARHQVTALKVHLLIPLTGGGILHDGGDLLPVHQHHLVGHRLHLFGAVQQDAVEIGSFHPYSSLSVPAQAVFFQYLTFAEAIKDICRFFFCLLH